MRLEAVFEVKVAVHGPVLTRVHGQLPNTLSGAPSFQVAYLQVMTSSRLLSKRELSH